MNRDEFIMLVRDSGLVDRRFTGEVRELIDIYPYFQSAHLLLLKGLGNTSDIKFRNQLSYSALYVANREVLYHLLSDMEESQPVQAERSAETGESVNTYTETPVAAPLPEKVVGVISAEEIQKESVPLPKEEALPHITESTTTDAVTGADDLLELEYPEVKESGEPVAGDVAGTPVNRGREEQDKIKSQSELINKFILANPRIEPVREKTDTPLIDISEPFVEAKGGFVTETLARIYLNQHYYSRAIDIYEKLSLKFPEKSSYFAAQIEKIKTLIK
jgi:hypothetical protein